jgi:SH3-like domain-containing protein
MKLRFSIYIVIFGLATSINAAKNPADFTKLPRFMTLRAGKVNMRVGPGKHFPIDWVYQKEHLPVEVTAEFQEWYKMKDADGTVGWVNKKMLSHQPYALVIKNESLLKADSSQDSKTLSKISSGVIAQVVKCQKSWCQLKFQQMNGIKGYLPLANLWGAKEE